jgi:hypothetical protein
LGLGVAALPELLFWSAVCCAEDLLWCDLVDVGRPAGFVVEVAFRHVELVEHSLDWAAGVAVHQYLTFNAGDRQRWIPVVMGWALGLRLARPAVCFDDLVNLAEPV